MLQVEDASGLQKTHGFWSTSCVCLDSEQGRPCEQDRYARVLVFFLRNIASESNPGFTITFRQSSKPEILRVSLYPDFDAPWDLRKSVHWLAPTIRPPFNEPLAEADLYHSSVLDQSFQSPTGSGIEILVPTGIVTPQLETIVTSSFRPIATQIPEVPDSVPYISTRLSSQPSATPTPAFIVQSKDSIQDTIGISDHVANNFGDKVQGVPQVAFVQAAFTQAVHKLPAQIASYSEDASGTPNILGNSVPLSRLDTTVEHSPTQLSEPSATSSTPFRYQIPLTDQAVRAFQITSLIIIPLTVITAIFVFVFRNPRRRADILANREERRRRNQYRCAAHQHKVRSWYRSFKDRLRRPCSVLIAQTWEEKQVLAVQPEGTSAGSMRDELRALRMAHEVVDGIVQAEEGRNTRKSFKSLVRKIEKRARSFSASSTSSTRPPPYEENYDEGEIVVDGFHYTHAGRDCTPESSVISTSPRTSIYMRDSDSEKD